MCLCRPTASRTVRGSMVGWLPHWMRVYTGVTFACVQTLIALRRTTRGSTCDTRNTGVYMCQFCLCADPDRIKKDREREERVRLARERLEEERKKKLVELQEQQRQAQENREKQLEMRRKKIEDLRRRDVERRAEVERRRRERENAEKVSRLRLAFLCWCLFLYCVFVTLCSVGKLMKGCQEFQQACDLKSYCFAVLYKKS